MASLRMRLALDSGSPSLRLLRDPTPFEARALAEQLREIEGRLLNREFGERDLFAWARHFAEYTTLRPDTRTMVESARLVAGMLGVRLRFDPALREDRAARAMTVSLRSDLVRLGAHVRSLPGYTSVGFESDAGDPTAAVARRLAEQAEIEAAAAAPDPNAATLDELAASATSRPADPEAKNKP